MNNNNNTRQNRNRRGTRRRRQNNRRIPRPLRGDNILFGHGSNVRIPRRLHPTSPTPMTEIVKMSFVEPNLVINSAVSSFVVREWRINDIFDPDPLVGGGTVAGYTYYSTAYNRYRVFKHVSKFTVCGNEPAVPVSFGLIWRDARPSLSITSYATALDALEIGPSTGLMMVGQTTGASIYRSRLNGLHPGALMGDPQEYMSDISWGGSTGSSPGQTVWMAFIAVSISPLINLTNGVLLTMNQYFTVKWSSSQKILERPKLAHNVACQYCASVHTSNKHDSCVCDCHASTDEINDIVVPVSLEQRIAALEKLQLN
jgi:hypothetical protein